MDEEENILINYRGFSEISKTRKIIGKNQIENGKIYLSFFNSRNYIRGGIRELISKLEEELRIELKDEGSEILHSAMNGAPIKMIDKSWREVKIEEKLIAYYIINKNTIIIPCYVWRTLNNTNITKVKIIVKKVIDLVLEGRENNNRIREIVRTKEEVLRKYEKMMNESIDKLSKEYKEAEEEIRVRGELRSEELIEIASKKYSEMMKARESQIKEAYEKEINELKNKLGNVKMYIGLNDTGNENSNIKVEMINGYVWYKRKMKLVFSEFQRGGETIIEELRKPMEKEVIMELTADYDRNSGKFIISRGNVKYLNGRDFYLVNILGNICWGNNPKIQINNNEEELIKAFNKVKENLRILNFDSPYIIGEDKIKDLISEKVLTEEALQLMVSQRQAMISERRNSDGTMKSKEDVLKEYLKEIRAYSGEEDENGQRTIITTQEEARRRICERCEEEYSESESSANERTRYCTIECEREANRPTCEQCGRRYHVENSFAEEDERFCSVSCENEYNEENNENGELECEECGGEYDEGDSNANSPTRFCCQQCERTYNEREENEERENETITTNNNENGDEIRI